MFGTFRTVLALLVVAQHAYCVPSVGGYAVATFYCLSGFLMTLLRCEAYQAKPFDFFVNRFLRVFPMYWAVCLVTAAFVLIAAPTLIGGDVNGYGVPTTVKDVLKNAFFLQIPPLVTLVPPGWAVTNELLFYTLIGLGATTTLTRSAVCLLLTLALCFGTLNIPAFYFSPSAAALPFALGSVLYHAFRARSDKTNLGAAITLGLAGIVVLIGVAVGVSKSTVGAGILNTYAHMIGLTLIFLALFQLRPGRLLGAIDEQLGRLSYPIYLSHFLGIIVISGRPPFWRGEWWFPHAVLAFAVVFSILLLVLVDRPVQNLRRAIRERPAPRKAGDSQVDRLVTVPSK
jgi:peptidoglycan/LPS O-acetylase OafA/YrhL